MLVIPSECPRCGSRMFGTRVTTQDLLTYAYDSHKKSVKCKDSFHAMEGRLECPQCAVVIHVFVPVLETFKEKAK